MRASFSGLLTYSASAVLAYATVQIGYSRIYTQISDPYFSGILWPVSVVGVLMLILVSAVVILAILLEVIEGVEVPLLYGRTTYTLVGSAGLLGSSLGAVRILQGWNANTGIAPTLESIVAAVLVVVPSAYASYRLWQPTESDQDPSTTKGDEFEPEFVRDKTAQWDSEPAQHQHQNQSSPETLELQRQLHSDHTERESQQERRSDRKQGVDLSETEFDWAADTGVSFEDVGGMDGLKAELDRDVIKPLTTHREKAEELGISPTNIIFHGPPGTGKTFMAQALATELGLPFAKLSGADVQSKWINESSQKVQALFEEAESVAEKAGGAVVFFDELDSVLKNRSAGRAHEEDTKVVNEFLNRLENTGEHNIVFIGATNRLESLDEAGTRSGRIDKKIHIGVPDFEARMSILKVQLDDRPHCLTEGQIGAIAERTEGMTAADLTSLVESAARNSLFDRGGDTVTHNDLYRALND